MLNQNVLKKCQVKSIMSKRTCMKRLMEVGEAKEFYQEQEQERSMVYAYAGG